MGQITGSLGKFNGRDTFLDAKTMGEDAIRVDLFTLGSNGKPLYLRGSKRVHRVRGWRNNLKRRLDHWQEFMPRDICPSCGRPMLVRINKAKQTKFLGCCDYPACKETLPYHE